MLRSVCLFRLGKKGWGGGVPVTEKVGEVLVSLLSENFLGKMSPT